MISALAAPAIEAHHQPAILAVFVLTYAAIAVGFVPGLKLDRTGIALLGAIGMMVFGGVTTSEAASYINWPTVALLFGFFVISAQLQLSGFYSRVAEKISAQLDRPARFLGLLMVVTASLSAFLTNDIVCYIFVPIVGSALIAKRLNPVPFLIALAISSNLGAAATILGNPQGMLIAQVAKLSFGEYLWWCLPPVILALGAAYGIIWFLSRQHFPAQGSTPITSSIEGAPSFDRVHTIKGLVILAVVVGLFFTSIPKEIVALVAAAIHLASPKFRTGDLLTPVQWPILIIFMALFVITGAFQSAGFGDDVAHWLAQSGFNLNDAPRLVLATAVLSNIISNSPAVMLLLKIVPLTAPTTAYILALANSFGGSLFIVGSVANIIVVQQARTLGVEIKFREFAKLGIPVTLAALGCLTIWVVLRS